MDTIKFYKDNSKEVHLLTMINSTSLGNYVVRNEMILKLKEEYHLPCPEEMGQVNIKNNKNVNVDL